jgi:hypothetical protein
VVAGAGACDEQDTAFALEVLSVCGGVLSGGCDCRRGGDGVFLHADAGDRLELQALHGVHGADPCRILAVMGGECTGGDMGGLECFPGGTGDLVGPGGYPDDVKFDADIEPGADNERG